MEAGKLLEKLKAEKESLNPLVIRINKESVFSILYNLFQNHLD